MKFLSKFHNKKFREKIAFRSVVFISIIISIVSTVYCYFTGLVFSQGDGLSRLMIARRVVDGIHNGIAQLGAVWPPIPQIFMVPLVWNDFLYRTTLAGDIISMVCYVLAVVFLYKLLLTVTKDITAGIIGVLVFSNPNILYMQSTPMSELPFLMFIIMSIYFLLIWVKDVNKLQNLLLTGVALAFASLTRFESWLLYFMEIVVILYTSFKNRFSYFKTESSVILFSVVGLFGIVLWLLWNQLIFNNVLYFMTSEYGSRSQWTDTGTITNGGNIILSFLVYWWAVVDNAGWIVTILSSIGLVLLFFKKESSTLKIAALSLLFPFFFYFLALYKGGIVTLQVPQLMSDGYYNIRYGLLMLPAIAFFTAYIAQKRNKWIKIIIILLVILSSLLTMQEGLVDISGSGYRTGQFYSSYKRETIIGDWLKAHYNGGLVLLQNTGNEIITFTFSKQYPLKDVIYEGDQDAWTSALQNPAINVQWIFMNSDANGKPDKVWNALHGTPQLLSNYKLVYSYQGTEVYEKKSK